MARNATIHRARLVLSHVDRGVYVEQTLTLAQHPSETLERALVRLLAYGLRYDEGLAFGRGVSTRDEPDLWRCALDGRVLEWIEVGQPEAVRMAKASRRAEACRIFVFGAGADRWREAQLESASMPDGVGVARLDDAFVAALAEAAARPLRWSMTVSEGTIFLDANDRSFESTPEVWRGDPLG
jgi:uncharacterized protein YaeQ